MLLFHHRRRYLSLFLCRKRKREEEQGVSSQRLGVPSKINGIIIRDSRFSEIETRVDFRSVVVGSSAVGILRGALSVSLPRRRSASLETS